MKKLLLGYDASEPSREAARMAGRIAEKLGGSVTVLTVGQLATAVGTSVLPTVEESSFRPIVEQGAQIVRALGANAETRVRFGEPAQVLIDIAAEEGYDMLIVGHRGLGGIKSLLLGSVAKKVATGALCPVMVVRGSAPATIRKVLAAVDGSEHAERALEAGATLAKAFAAPVTLVHVVFPPLLAESKLEAAARRTGPSPEQQAGHEALARACEICLRSGVDCDSVQLGVGCESVFADGPPCEVICRYAQHEGYDLVTVGRRGMGGVRRLLLGSVSDEVLSKAGPLVLLSGEHPKK